MAEYQTIDTPHVFAEQWVEGTTTLATIRTIAPEAFTRDGKLYLPRATDPYATEPVPNNGYVYHEAGSEKCYAVLQSVFEDHWELTPPPGP